MSRVIIYFYILGEECPITLIYSPHSTGQRPALRTQHTLSRCALPTAWGGPLLRLADIQCSNIAPGLTSHAASSGQGRRICDRIFGRAGLWVYTYLCPHCRHNFGSVPRLKVTRCVQSFFFAQVRSLPHFGQNL